MKYDQEERNIIDAYESGKMKLSTPSKKNQKILKLQPKILLKKIKELQ